MKRFSLRKPLILLFITFHFFAFILVQIHPSPSSHHASKGLIARGLEGLLNVKARAAKLGILRPFYFYNDLSCIERHTFWLYAPNPLHDYSVFTVEAVVGWDGAGEARNIKPRYSREVPYVTCLGDWLDCISGQRGDESRNFKMVQNLVPESRRGQVILKALADYGLKEFTERTGAVPLRIDVVRYLWPIIHSGWRYELALDQRSRDVFLEIGE